MSVYWILSGNLIEENRISGKYLCMLIVTQYYNCVTDFWHYAGS